MLENTVTKIIKIKMFPTGEQEIRKATWNRVRDLSHTVWKASNMIMTSLYMKDSLLSYVCRSNGVDIKNSIDRAIEQEKIDALFLTKTRFAIKNKAGVIKLEDLSGFGKDDFNNILSDKYNFVLRHWGYYRLQSMIKYKAEAQGIKVVFVDPHYTSQTCSRCENLEPGQRISQSEFKCKKCGFTAHADYNSALIISRKPEIVKIKPGSGLKSEAGSLVNKTVVLPTKHSLTLHVQEVV
jgi:IS605 OrfB family transposase